MGERHGEEETRRKRKSKRGKCGVTSSASKHFVRERQTGRKRRIEKADACPTCTLIVIMAKDKCREIIL